MSDPHHDAFEYRDNAEHHEAQHRMGHLQAYYAWTLSLFGDDLQGPAADAGAGSGHFSALLAERVSPVLLLEGGTDNLAVLRQRFAGNPAVTVVDCDLEQCEGLLREHAIRSIFTLDVLEHLPDDVAVLRQFHGALPPSGRVYIKVPALPWLYGPVDEASGHYRRYTKASLRKAVETAGFRVEKCRYMNLAGVPPYFLKSRILERQENFSRTFTPKQIERIRKLMPALKLADSLSGPPIGLSVVCVAVRP
ncbi:class I SAM-dependent methyltransferase [Luteimonas marina]|uniref:Class I SAM-dependent methyltransferase n=1 Tax=Luteimonas marina TaxID=488485 RepID=A0A5C5TWQ4_9GAMM|nr:methyltransferase domain-containing protein [Luteimonas marina]TWT18623.1 class I SAM-dependent methyltransferase [Luteimonas marina]